MEISYSVLDQLEQKLDTKGSLDRDETKALIITVRELLKQLADCRFDKQGPFHPRQL